MTTDLKATPDPFLCTDYNPWGDWCQRSGHCTCAEIERLRAEVASLRLTLGGRTFSGQPVPDPIGCPMPGACAQVAEIKRLRRGWLRVIQQENSCPATGGGCLAKRCGCVEEMEVLANEKG